MVNGMKVARRVVHVLGDRAGAQHDPERVEQDASVDGICGRQHHCTCRIKPGNSLKSSNHTGRTPN
jgi:hypothetical protein